jgi:hypothetical protein
MKSRLNILVAAAVLLLLFNIIKWSGVWKSGKEDATESATIRRLQVDFQRPVGPKGVKVLKNIFTGGPAGEFYSQNGNETVRPEWKNRVAVQAPTAIPEKKWPDFKISGTALNDGKKSAFFSGPAFSGVVGEGADINDGYKLGSINERNVEITDKITNETRKYSLEGK